MILSDPATQLWRSALGGTESGKDLDIGDAVEVCQKEWPAGFESFLLPLLVPRKKDFVFKVVEHLTLSSKWPTDYGFAKLVIPQILFRTRGQGISFLKHLLNHGNRHQRKAVAESLRSAVYLEPVWAIEALHRCAENKYRAIREEAAKALPCVNEVDFLAARELRKAIMRDEKTAELIDIYDVPDEDSPFGIVQEQQWIDVGSLWFRFHSSGDLPNMLFFTLLVGLPGLLLVDPAYGVSRAEYLFKVGDTVERSVIAVHASILLDCDTTATKQILTRMIESETWEVRRCSVIALARLAVSGDQQAYLQLQELTNDSTEEVVTVSRIASEVVRSVQN